MYDTQHLRLFSIHMETEVQKVKIDGENDILGNTTDLSQMAVFLEKSPLPPGEGDLVEGPVVATAKNKVFIELHPFGTGIIYGREFLTASDILRRVKPGDTIAAKVVGTANSEGYIELSLMEARQALIWAEAEKAVAKGTVFEVLVKEANKGGLMLEWQGVTGFLPASQLKPENYPRVEDGDRGKILEELKQLVGHKLSVVIITADAEENKLIFSERGPQEEKGSTTERFAVGDTVEGEVTGAVDFGIFIKIDEGLEGLVHISEIDWGLVENPKSMYKIGEKLNVKVIEIKDGKVSLSIKALKENPWKSAAEKYKRDQMVEATIIKYNKHGALASIEEGVAGLVHISEFASAEELHKSLELGRSYKFKITLFEPASQRMTLSFKYDKAEKDVDKK
ncbi:MAG: RNA binding S1 domain protein [Parcubacteria group bacterium GW2011_GWA2_43_11]|nr:MAG: RNA binding S1 domain protein [Parcubacteria group bacterium GW2011_GWA2_43_11]